MKHLVALSLVGTGLLAIRLGASVPAADLPGKSDREAIVRAYRELAKRIPGDDWRSKSARFKILFAEQSHFVSSLPERKSVRTVDGKNAELVLLRVPSSDPHGEDFSMAVLLIEGRAVDWASCWAPTEFHELLLEDIDGDHVPDVAFRVTEGNGNADDDRQHRRMGDPRFWLLAYSITSKGLKSIFPIKDRLHHFKVSQVDVDGPLAFQVTGLPKTLPESEMCECTVSAKNISNRPVVRLWKQFYPEFINAGGECLNRSFDKLPATLQPGETVSATIILRFEADHGLVTLRWGPTPKRHKPVGL